MLKLSSEAILFTTIEGKQRTLQFILKFIFLVL